MRSFGETISNAASNPFSKFVEVDDWFASKRSQLEALENQLKGLLKSVESVVKQRKGRLREGWKRERERERWRVSWLSRTVSCLTWYAWFLDLGGAIADFGESMIPLASAELDRDLSTHLIVLADIQKRMKELHEQQVCHWERGCLQTYVTKASSPTGPPWRAFIRTHYRWVYTHHRLNKGKWK